jgi:hypothetical protein
VDERDNIGREGKKGSEIINRRSEIALLSLKDLAGKNNLNVTDVYFFSDYIPAKYQDIQSIVSESFRKTRSN